MTWRFTRPTWSRPVPPTRWVPVVVVLALVAATITGLTVAPQAQAATNLGSLVLNPLNGTTSDIVLATTVSSGASKGCPSQTLTVVGRLSGPGGWASGIIAVSRLDSGISTTDEFTVGLSDTIGGLATSNGLQIAPGDYTLTLRCQNLSNTIYGEFTTTLTFTDATHYTSVDPTTPTPTATPTVGPTNPTGPVATTTTLTTSPSGSSAQGSTLTLTATVSPASAVGSVTFRDGDAASGTVLGSATVAGGQASVANASLATGSHSLVASFVPASAQVYSASTSAAVAHTVTAATEVPLIGTLTFDPLIGGDITPLSVTTVSSPGRTPGCPTDTTRYRGTVVGPGDWAAGFPVIQTGEDGLSTTRDFSVNVSNSFSGTAANNGLQVVAGKYEITLNCLVGNKSVGRFVGNVWFTDPTHYQTTDPANSQIPTQILVTVSPEDRADVGTPVTLTADVNPPSVVGTVQFTNTVGSVTGNFGPPIVVRDGFAGFVATDVPFGLYQFTATFVPADVKKFGPSSSVTKVFAAAKIIPPKPGKGGATITGAAKDKTAKVGTTLTCAADFSKADSRSWRWFQGWDKQIGTAKTYKVKASDKGKKLRCQALATNTGGTTFRWSKAVAVPR